VNRRARHTPQPVRPALPLKEGDEIAHAVERNRVVLTRARLENTADDPFQTFTEWDDQADTEAHAGF